MKPMLAGRKAKHENRKLNVGRGTVGKTPIVEENKKRRGGL